MAPAVVAVTAKVAPDARSPPTSPRAMESAIRPRPISQFRTYVHKDNSPYRKLWVTVPGYCAQTTRKHGVVSVPIPAPPGLRRPQLQLAEGVTTVAARLAPV